MDTSTLDFNTLTLLVAMIGSTLTIVTLMFRQSNRQEDAIKSLDGKVGILDTKFTVLDTQVTGLDTKVTGLEGKVTGLEGKVDVMGRDVSDIRERLARVEGHLITAEGFRMRGLDPAPVIDSPPEDPSADRRQAG